MTAEVGIRLSLVGAAGVQAGIADVNEVLGQTAGAATRSADATEALSAKLGAMAQGFLGMQAVRQAAQWVLDFGDAMLKAQVRAESLTTGLKFAVAGPVAQELAYLRETTSGMGLEFASTAKSYMQFSAAARETALEGAGVRKVFEAVSKASTVMGLSAAENQGVLLALGQMMSKGTVQAEELRGQLGERLPGSFQIAARAMGVTTAELGKMLEQGQVLSEDFLPKFARQLESELGDSAAKAGERTEAAINRMGNAWERLKQGVAGSGVAEALAGQLTVLGDAMDGMAESIARAKSNGGGFFSQLLAGSGAVLQFLNPFNAIGYTAQSIGGKLMQAEDELKKLNEGLQSNPGNIFLRQGIKDTEDLITSLQAAKREQQGLTNFRALDNQTMAELARAEAADARRAAAEMDAFDKAQKEWEKRRIKELAEEEKKRAEAAAKAMKDQQGALLELAGFQKDFYDKAAVYNALRAKGLITENKYLEAMRELASRQPVIKAQLDAQAKAAEELWKWREKEADSAQKRADTIAEQVTKQQAENDAMRYTKQELAALSQARLDDDIRIAAEVVQRDELLGYCSRETEAHKATLQALLDLSAARNEGVHLAAAKEAADEWQKTADTIDKGLTDSLFRAFESGKGFFTTLWEGVKNTFKTTILQPVIKAVLAPVTSSIGSLFSGGASAAGAGGSALGDLGSLAGIAGSLGSFGTAAGYGLSAAFGGTASTAISSGVSMIGAGSFAEGAGLAAGAAAPYVLAAVAAYQVFKSLTADKNAKLGFGSTTGARAFGFGRGTDVGSQDQLVALARAVQGGISGTAAALGGSAAGIDIQAATDIDRKGKGSGIIGILSGGSLVSGVQTGGTNPFAAAATKLDDAGKLGDWFAATTSAAIIAGLQKSDLPARFADFFGSVQAFGLTRERADAMLATAQGVKTLTDALSPLGGVFGQLGSLGVEATASLAALTGGFEQFTAKANDYVRNFYSQDEQMALLAVQVKQALQGAGINADLSTKAEFRALVDSSNLGTQAGQQQLAALLNVQGQFAQIADYLKASGQTVEQLAATAPPTALAQLDASQRMANGIDTLVGATRSASDSNAAALDALRQELAAVRADLVAAVNRSAITTRTAIEDAGFFGGSANDLALG
ncbi:MAG: tape measure protein [Burkholderiaceae bacterium]|nr:tape measure protein [Burkholderiaceae bacterium]